jgi:hypothetical protein
MSPGGALIADFTGLAGAGALLSVGVSGMLVTYIARGTRCMRVRKVLMDDMLTGLCTLKCTFTRIVRQLHRSTCGERSEASLGCKLWDSGLFGTDSIPAQQGGAKARQFKPILCVLHTAHEISPGGRRLKNGRDFIRSCALGELL